MAYYIKCRPIVAETLGLADKRVKTPDGNYQLWQADLAAIGPVWKMDEICAEIGARMLTPYESMHDLNGSAEYPLPEPTDPKWADDGNDVDSNNDTDTETDTDNDTDSNVDTEADAEEGVEQ